MIGGQRSIVLILVAVLLVTGTSFRATASEVAVVDILSDLEGYSGRRVTVGGRITNLRTGTFRSRQKQYTFDLSDGTRSILVFGSGAPPCRNGAPAIVVGTLGTTRRPNGIAGTIDAVDVQCR